MKDGRDKGIKKGILSGSGGGILASLCCIGPLVIILFGLGSVSFALSIGQYRPYFLGFGVLFMVFAIVLHLRKKNCLSAGGLKKEKYFIISTVLSMGVIYFVALYVAVPAISPGVYGGAGDPGPVDNPDLRKLTLKIDGMTCQGCADTIENALKGMDGIVEAKVSYSTGVGEVTYDPGKIPRETIMDSEIFKTYSAEIISDECC